MQQKLNHLNKNYLHGDYVYIHAMRVSPHKHHAEIAYMVCIQTIQLNSYLNSYRMTRVTYMETAANRGGF